jgi:putative tricarboxylic transport membrane protein
MIMAVMVPAARAQTAYPARVVTLVTHSSPGGGSDVFLREMAPHLSAILHATIIVENVRGGSSARAMAALARAKPDGGTFYATTPTFIFTSLLSTPATSYRDLEPLVNIFYDPEVLYTAADSRFETLRDVIDHARRDGGKWGAANPASLERHTLERLKQKAGVAAAIATFEGGGDMQLNVLNHTLDMGIGELQEIVGQLGPGKVRLLAVAGDERLPQYPGIETVKEQGIDLSVRKFRGLAAPRGTPPAVIAAWEAAIPLLLDDPAYKRIYLANGLQAGFIPHAAYVAFINEFGAQTEAFLEDSGNAIPQSLDEASDGDGLPTLYAWLLAGLSLILIVRSVSRLSPAGIVAAGEGPARQPLARGRAAGMLAIGILYVSIVPWLGYMLSLAGLIAATTCYQGRTFNRRVAFVAIGGAAFLWFLFVALLRIPQPAGLWPSLR